MKQQTLGEYRVGVSFNPSGSGTVENIKRKAADLIDEIDKVQVGVATPEAGRLKALAMTAVEEGAMWAVKAATKTPHV